MGGPGSGNFYHARRPLKRSLVEHCRRLDMSLLVRDRLVRLLAYTDSTITFGDRSTIGLTALIASVETALVQLHYSTGHDPPVAVNETVPLTTTRPRLGGVRWWFLCPGEGCGRRVGVLFQPPGSVHFRCRACHNLTYSSQQNGHRYRVFFETELGRAMRPLLDRAGG